jgi:hypothetical protein
MLSASTSRSDDMWDAWRSTQLLDKFPFPADPHLPCPKIRFSHANIPQSFIRTSIRGLSLTPQFVAGIYRTGVGGFGNAAPALQGENPDLFSNRDLPNVFGLGLGAAFRKARASDLHACIAHEYKRSPFKRNLDRLHTTPLSSVSRYMRIALRVDHRMTHFGFDFLSALRYIRGCSGSGLRSLTEPNAVPFRSNCLEGSCLCRRNNRTTS